MSKLLKVFRNLFGYAALFSLAMNILLLAPVIYLLQVFDRVITSRSIETLLMLSIAVVLATAILLVIEIARARVLAGIGVALDGHLAPRVLAMLMRKTGRAPSGQLPHGMRDVATLRAFLTGPGIFALFDAPWLPLFLVVIFLFHPALGMTALAGALLLVALAVANERLVRAPIERLQESSRRAARVIDAGLRNSELVEALGMAPAVASRWETVNREALAEQRATNGIASVVTGATRFVRLVVQAAMLGVGAYLVIEQRATPGVMVAATILLGRALAPVEMLLSGWKQIVEARAAYRRLDALIRSETPAPDRVSLPAPRGALSIEQVAYATAAQDKPVLRGISFELAPGHVLAVLGPSGAGKSTLARLLVGAWSPASGTVRIDGADMATWPREELGPHIGYLPQHIELFAGTVAENIARLGVVDSGAVIAAAARANAHEMIVRLPQGYETAVGEAGQALSAGQRQRIAFARALYGTPRYVVLDEPSAALDGDGEMALIKTLHELKAAGTTIVVVTHRPSLLGVADDVLVLVDGTVMHHGPRDDVLPRLQRAPGAATVHPIEPVARAGAWRDAR